jgi:hypothetical protein
VKELPTAKDLSLEIKFEQSRQWLIVKHFREKPWSKTYTQDITYANRSAEYLRELADTFKEGDKVRERLTEKDCIEIFCDEEVKELLIELRSKGYIVSLVPYYYVGGLIGCDMKVELPNLVFEYK